MVASIRFKSLAEERAWQKRHSRKRFKVAEVAKYLGESTRAIRAEMRKLRMDMSAPLSRGQAAKLILHIRQQQGDKILREAVPDKKVTFLG